MKWHSRRTADPAAGAGITRRLAARWRAPFLRMPLSLRGHPRASIVAFAAALLVGLSALVLVAGPRFARAGTAAVAAAPGIPYVWGLNGNGELGTASTNTCSGYPCSNTPLALSALSNVKALAGGDLHSLAATADGSVYAWGDNSSGQLGVTTRQTCYGQPCSPIPVQVTGMPAIAAVAGGEFHSLALTTTGAVYAWGSNYDGELGIGSTTEAASPILVTGLPANITAIAAGGEDSLALTSGGLLYAWGNNASGQLGATTTTTCGTTPCSTTPVQVSGLSGVTAIAEGGGFSLALTSNGTVYAWGDNTYGTLGNGSTTNSATPVPAAGIASVTAIAAGGSFALALTNSGTVYAWGENLSGELGASSSQTCGIGYACSATPLLVNGLPAGITAIAAGGGEFALALAGDSTVWSWGNDAIGQLGNGSSDPNPHPTPGQVTGLSGVGAVAAGGNHALVILPPAGGPTPTSTSTPSTAPVAVLSTTFINFGTQQIGTTSSPSPVTLSNTGTATLNVTGAALSGANPTDFILAAGSCVSGSGGTSVQIAPGGSCTMSIAFQPTGTGARSGTLTVTCDAANCPLSGSVTGNGINPSGSLSPTSISFPDTPVGSTSESPVLLGICNGGTTDLVISAISMSGANPGDFGYSIPSPLPIVAHPGDCQSIYPNFTPSAAGPRSATLTVTTNDSLHTLTAALSGTGTAPSGSVSPTSVGFPDTYVGSSSTPTPVVVTNSGTGDLVVSAITLVGTNPGDFSYAISGGATLPVTVHPGSSLTVNTTFAPSAAWARSATLSFTTNDSLHPLSTALGGNGLLKADDGVTLGASPNPVKSGTHLTYTVMVTNNGPGVSNDVTLSDTLPAGTTFYSVAATQGSCSAPAVGHTGTVTCTVSSLPNGSSFTVMLVVTVTIRSGTLTDTASVSASTPDPNSANNSASVSTSVVKH